MVQSERLMSVGKLAGGMAYEINGPLTGIDQAVQEIFNRVNEQNTENLAAADRIGLSFDDLGRYLLDQGVVNNLNAIMNAGKKASGIVENMLSFSGITTEGFVIDDISRLLDQALELASVEYGLGQDFDFNAVQIMTDYDPDLPKVKCRAGELKQVFFHILSNGAYAMAGHTDNPCPTFFIRTYSKEDQVCVEIRDNGPGMSETISTRIFEPLFSTKPDKSGAGLGLSLAHFIITENHNGAVEVESTPGEGTCFRIYLPC